MIERAINIFAAYKFESAYFDKKVLEDAIEKAIKNAEKELQKEFKDIKLRFIKQSDIPTGENMIDFVKNSLNGATVNIFELSDSAPNVTFELGYSMGISNFKYTKEEGYNILIHRSDKNYTEVISDLAGKFIVGYEYPARKNKDFLTLQKSIETIQETIKPKLQEKIRKLLEDEKFLKSLVWRMQQEKVNIICPYIPPEDQERYGVRSALAEYGDFNTVHETCIFLRGVLNCEVNFCHSQKLPNDLSQNHVVFVGGPTWNPQTKEYIEEYDLPFKYEWFIEEDKEDYIFKKSTNEKFCLGKERTDGKDVIVKDYGIFAVLPSKYASDKVVILINGIRSFGGLGALRAFTGGGASEENCKLVIKRKGFKNYFVVLVESDIRWDEFPYPKRIKESDIITYNPETKSWE